MTDGVYDPLARYRDEFRERFASLAREKFKALAERSGVDAAENRALAGKIRILEKRAASASGWKTFAGCVIAIGFAGAAAAAAFAARTADPQSRNLCIAVAAAGAAAGIAAIFAFLKKSKLLKSLASEIDGGKRIAWRQMEPLNRLYGWGIPADLAEQTVPRLAFDSYLSEARLDSLRRSFGWSDSFNEDKSVLCALSGEIGGSPFVFCHYREMEWGMKTYEGTRTISWTEWERDSEGRRRAVTRYQTLVATVTKPYPEYNERKILLFGNDAAPNLSFTRAPSGLSGEDGALWSSIKKKWRLSRLKAFSRNLDDDSNFTLMGNHEFETWFHAKDRDNEVEFRMLFTPVAQMQMLNLMKDSDTGYGDDFAFVKRGKMNLIVARHLAGAAIDTGPARFRNWDFDAAEARFSQFNERFFKDVYFALAPLLSIPLYQQPGGGSAGGGDPAQGPSSFWEHEAAANGLGEENFEHGECATPNILKTRILGRENGESEIEVSAHGFRGVDRVDFESVLGGDGKWHTVDVPWVEYLPVRKTGVMFLRESAPDPGSRGARAEGARASSARGAILSRIARP